MKPIAITSAGVYANIGRSYRELKNFLLSPEIPPLSLPRQPLNIDVGVYSIPGEWPDPGAAGVTHSLTDIICMEAARQCLTDTPPPDTLINGTSTGGQELCENAISNILKGRTPNDFHYPLQGDMAATTRAVAEAINFNGQTATISTACTSSANAIALGAAMIERGEARRVLAGGGDALCATTIAGFHILQLTGNTPATPFASDRRGLTLGEGAAFLMLEPVEEAEKAGRTIMALLTGFGMSSDAHHMTAPDPSGGGARRAVFAALERAGLTPDDIHFVNAHGTGTKLNDSAEATLVRDIFRDVPVASLKGASGHTLGGAGAIEAAASVASLEQRRAFANFNSPPDSCDPDCPVRLTGPNGVPLPPNANILSNSFAFGGNNCVLIFQGVD